MFCRCRAGGSLAWINAEPYEPNNVTALWTTDFNWLKCHVTLLTNQSLLSLKVRPDPQPSTIPVRFYTNFLQGNRMKTK